MSNTKHIEIFIEASVLELSSIITPDMLDLHSAPTLPQPFARLYCGKVGVHYGIEASGRITPRLPRPSPNIRDGGVLV